MTRDGGRLSSGGDPFGARFRLSEFERKLDAGTNPFLNPEFRRVFAETHRHGFTVLNSTEAEPSYDDKETSEDSSIGDSDVANDSKNSSTIVNVKSTKVSVRASTTEVIVDWRDQGVISDVKYQGSCGTCWAFVTTGLIESRYAIDYGTLISISEQQVMDCSRNDINQACTGGNQYTAIVGWQGNFYTEELYPYILTESAQNKRDTAADDDTFCSSTYTRQGVFALNESTSIASLSPRTEAALIAALDVGPVSVAVAGYNDPFLEYTGGILDSMDCDTEDSVDHALLLVGYGTEDGKDYYIAKNSWGPAWGEDGYVRLARNVANSSRPYGACNLLTQANYLEPYSVECDLAYNTPCSTYANSEFCTVENGCQSESFYASTYSFSTSSGSSSDGGLSKQDSIYVGVAVSIGVLLALGVALFVRKIRRENREEKLAEMKLEAFRGTVERRTAPKDKYDNLLPEFRNRLKEIPQFRKHVKAESDEVLLEYLEDHDGNLDSALYDYMERHS